MKRLLWLLLVGAAVTQAFAAKDYFAEGPPSAGTAQEIGSRYVDIKNSQLYVCTSTNYSSVTKAITCNWTNIGTGNFASPGTIGGTTPGAIHATTIDATGGITAIADGVHAQIDSLTGNTALPAIPSNSFGFIAPNSAAFSSFFFRPPTAGPTANGGLQFGPTSSSVSALSYSSLFDDGTRLSTPEPVVYPTGGTQMIASGMAALATGAISSAACATALTVSAPGVTAFDAINWNPNASIKAVTGYAPSTSGGLSIGAYPTSNNVNFDVCNWTASPITPGAVTLNWSIARGGCNSATALQGGIFSQYPSALAMTGWSAAGNGATETNQAFPAPDCTTNAFLLTEDGTTAEHFTIASITTTVSAGQTLTYTAYAKRVIGSRNFQMQLSNSGFTGNVHGGVSLADCSVLNAGTADPVWSGGTLTSTYIAPGWCKMVLTATATADTSVHADVSMLSGSTKVYAGDSTSQVAYWGIDLR